MEVRVKFGQMTMAYVKIPWRSGRYGLEEIRPIMGLKGPIESRSYLSFYIRQVNDPVVASLR
jgi:hypothetical protein